MAVNLLSHDEITALRRGLLRGARRRQRGRAIILGLWSIVRAALPGLLSGATVAIIVWWLK